jgi:hypothetical protein
VTTGSRNIRKGRTYRVPANSLDDDEGWSFSSDFESTFIALDKLQKRNVPLTGLAHATFIPILRENKRLEFKNRLRQASALSQGLAAVDDDFFLYRETHADQSVHPYEAAAAGMDGGYEDDGGVGGFWDNGDDDDNDIVDDCGPLPGNDDFADGQEAAQNAFDKSYRGAAGDDAYNRFFASEEDLVRRVEQALNDGLSQSQATSYEMICRQHIDNFMRGAEQYAR